MAAPAGPPQLPISTEIARSASGLEWAEIAAGVGRKVDPTDRIAVNSLGWLTNGAPLMYGRTIGRQTLRLADAWVLAGWKEGLVGMCVGGKRRLILPSDLAYGPRGLPPEIPPFSTLIYDIELLEIL